MTPIDQGKRIAGLLLHPTSLPGGHGVGSFGPEARDLVERAAGAGFGAWQMLPLGPTDRLGSPYAALSSFVLNPDLVSLDDLVADGVLRRSDLDGAPAGRPDRVDYRAVRRWRDGVLRAAYARVGAFGGEADDWTLFAALRAERGGRPWYRWPKALRRREPKAVDRARDRLADEIGYHGWVQSVARRQWGRVREVARSLDVILIGDLPIYVAGDSADVWSNPDLFDIDPDGRPRHVAGVPPDYFSRTGQRWGNPLYRWARHAADGYRWWIRRVEASLAEVDLLRLDHFRGFAAYWEVPASERTAERGRWVEGPGGALFDALRDARGDLPILAEDLGVITPDVVALRDRYRFPGMKVLQFGLQGDDGHAPGSIGERDVVYTGTHDNDTTAGWYRTLDAGTRRRVRERLDCSGPDVPAAMVRAAFASPARLAVVPVQDLLGLGSAARLNRPGRRGGNWRWRLTRDRYDAAFAVSARRP